MTNSEAIWKKIHIYKLLFIDRVKEKNRESIMYAVTHCPFDFKNRKLQSLEIKLMKQFYEDWTETLLLIVGPTIYESGIILENNI